mmetsp:Transcript_99997/g.282297  ORF Transcript_99997/g.282297 Transcript_99997/m.282297 type:complete len:213 (+) Transcript_99997:2656-3294(+)
MPQSRRHHLEFRGYLFRQLAGGGHHQHTWQPPVPRRACGLSAGGQQVVHDGQHESQRLALARLRLPDKVLALQNLRVGLGLDREEQSDATLFKDSLRCGQHDETIQWRARGLFVDDGRSCALHSGAGHCLVQVEGHRGRYFRRLFGVPGLPVLIGLLGLLCSGRLRRLGALRRRLLLGVGPAVGALALRPFGQLLPLTDALLACFLLLGLPL